MALYYSDSSDIICSNHYQSDSFKTDADNVNNIATTASDYRQQRTKELMQQAGIEAPVSKFWIGSLIFATIVLVAVKVFTSWPPIAVIFITITAFLGIPKMYLRRKAGKRQNKFLEEFPG